MAANHVTPSRVSVTDLAPVKIHIWRVLTMLVALAGVLAVILLIMASAA